MDNPPPLNLLQLKFDSMKNYDLYWEKYPGVFGKIWLWHESIGDHDGTIEWPGICEVCQSNTVFTVNPTRAETQGFSFKSHWTELMCRQCKLGARDRQLISWLKEIGNSNLHIYHVGYRSKIATYIRREFANAVCGQYKACLSA